MDIYYKKRDVIDGNNAKHNGNTCIILILQNGILCSFYMCTVSHVCSYDIFVYYTAHTGICICKCDQNILK